MRATTLLTLLPLATSILARATGGQAVYAREDIAGYDADAEPTTTSTYVVYVTITQTEEGAGYSTARVTPSPKPQQFHGNETHDDEDESEDGDNMEEEYMTSYPSGTGTWTTIVGGANNTGISGGPLPSQTDEAEGAAAKMVGRLGCMVAVGLAGLMAMM